MLGILKRGGSKGDMGEDGGDGREAGGSVGRVVCAELYALSNGSHFAERPFRALLHPLTEVKSRGYSLVPYSLHFF